MVLSQTLYTTSLFPKRTVIYYSHFMVIAFFPRPEDGRWFSAIGGTVGLFATSGLLV